MTSLADWEESSLELQAARSGQAEPSWVMRKRGEGVVATANLSPVHLPVLDEKIPADSITVSGAALVAREQLDQQQTRHAYVSRIFRGGFHLSRIVPFKDLLVPSGPMSSMLSTVFNLSNATLGAGILGMGLFVGSFGIVLSPFILLLTAVLGATCNSLLLRTAELTDSRTYAVAAFRTFGLPGAIILDVLTILSSFGSLCAYFVLIGDFVLPVAAALLSPQSLLATDRLVAMGLVGLFGILPLSLKRNINALEFYSMMSIVLVGLIVVVVTVLSAIDIARGEGAPDLVLARLNLESFFSLPVAFFAFSNITAVIPIFVEMASPTRIEFQKVMIWSGALCYGAYVLMGCLSYARFGAEVNGNLLNNFPVDTSVMILARAGFSFTIVTTYPLVMFPLRLSIEHLIFGVCRQFKPLEFSAVTLIVTFASFAVAGAVKDVGFIFGLTGSIGSASLMFILPAAMYLKAFLPKQTKRVPEWYLLIVAALLLLWGLTTALLGIIAFVSALDADPVLNVTNTTSRHLEG